MGLIKEVKYSYNDVTIVPAVVSHVKSRKECNPFNNDGTLPIFTAPMNTVVNEYNFKNFEENNIIPILPRTVDFKIRYDNSFKGKWSAYSLTEFKENFVEKINNVTTPVKVLIDVANGHMNELLELCKEAKRNNGDNLTIMTGNIANPKTYLEYCRSGIDYVRCSVGTGCFVKGTNVNTIDGLKKIEEISKNDKVLTHKKNYKNVVNTLEKEYNGKIIDINGVKCTPDHLFYVIKKEDANKITDNNYKDYGFWLEAENINTKKHLLIEFDT